MKRSHFWSFTALLLSCCNFCLAERPEYFSEEEWIPFSPKSFSCMGEVKTGDHLEVSLCATGQQPKGLDQQTCLPISFWTGICEADIEPQPDFTDYDESYEDILSTYDWNKTCFMYPETWPLCIGVENKQLYCDLWKGLPETLRNGLRDLTRR